MEKNNCNVKWEFYAFIDTNMWIYNEIKSIFLGKCDFWFSFWLWCSHEKKNYQHICSYCTGGSSRVEPWWNISMCITAQDNVLAANASHSYRMRHYCTVISNTGWAGNCRKDIRIACDKISYSWGNWWCFDNFVSFPETNLWSLVWVLLLL